MSSTAEESRSGSPPVAESAPLFDRVCTRFVLGRLSRWRSGAIDLILPDGSRVEIGPREGLRPLVVEVRDWRFFRRVLIGADIGFGEAYVDRDVEVGDIVELCRMFLRDQSMLDDRSVWGLAERAGHSALRWFRRNTLAGSQRNVQSHYDLSNDFYRLFLDPSMTYSCALYEEPGIALEEAQVAKLDDICARIDLGVSDRVLEIGCGWGSFALRAAKTRDCRVQGITISKSQHDLARQRIADAGLSNRVGVELCDYRKATGDFDAIVSIEMLEAVGYEYLSTYFEACASRLRPGGRMFLQTIAFPDRGFDRYRKDFDWVRKYVFPGGCLPSLHEISRVVKERTDLRIAWLRDIGPHYAPTLAAWRERFHERLEGVRSLGFDDQFARTWDYYLASCEAAFSTRYLSNFQIVLERPSRAG